MALFKKIGFKTSEVVIQGTPLVLSQLTALERAEFIELALEEAEKQHVKQTDNSAHFIAMCIQKGMPESADDFDSIKAELLELPEEDLVKLDKVAQKLCGLLGDDEEKKPSPEESLEKD